MMLLTGHYRKPFIVGLGAGLQLLPWSAVGSPTFELLLIQPVTMVMLQAGGWTR